jgi:adenine-specific DNA-methyltransferase
MSGNHSGRLELTWTDKDKTLLAHEDGTYEWVDPSDYRVAEVRLLHDVATCGEVRAPARRALDNLLIRGDALHALHALNRTPEFAKEYVGRIRLCYIDPPFNTGQAFEHYDDNLEHSVWLTMLRDRLEQIKPLLAPDGSVWVHLDDAEVHRCRLVLDEVFGEDKFVATVAWENFYGRSNAAAISPANNHIHVYSPAGKEAWRHVRNLLTRGGAALTKYANPDDDLRGLWRSGPIFAPEERHDGLMYEVTTPAGRKARPPKGSHWRMTEPEYRRMLEDGRIVFGADGAGAPAVKLFLSEVQDGLVPRSWWPHTEGWTLAGGEA